MVRIVIAGSRFFNDYKTLEEVVIRKLFELNKTYPEYNILTVRRSEKSYKINPENIEIISGMASGADSLAIKFANNYGLKLVEFPAEWKNLNAVPCKIMENSHGRYNDDTFGVLILFWDGKSKGSKNMKNQAIIFGMKIFEFFIR